ncbi:MAG: SDR family oxidoreductase [Elusimicrobiota bacterium]
MILVTGGAGYIGSVLVRRLLDRGYRVKVYDTFFFGEEPLEEVRENILIERGDIRDFNEKVLENIDAVIHLAALSNDPTAEYNPGTNMEINAEGTRSLARLCKKCGIKKFIYASSCSVYYTEEVCDDLKDENSPVSPAAPYSLSKLKGEEALLELADADFAPVLLRQGTVYGMSPRMRYDLVVNTMVKDIFTTGTIKVFARGEMWRPIISVNNIVDFYIYCLETDTDIGGEIINLVHKNYRIIDLAGQVKEVLKDIKDIRIDVQEFIPSKFRSYRVSNKKSRDLLGFTAEETPEDTAMEIYKSLEKNGLSEVNNPVYYNIQWMEEKGYLK